MPSRSYYHQPVRPRGTDKAYMKQVIVTESICGNGTEADPVRTVVQYWDADGTLLATNDPCK